MTVAYTESAYPVPLKENGLIVEYKSGAHSHDIPQKTRDLEIAHMLELLKAKPTFNPNLKFDPKKHLVFKEEYYKTTTTATLEDLGITKTRTAPISGFAAAHPFPLISQEAVDMMLWEAFQPNVIENYARLPNSGLSKGTTRLDFHLGGHCRYIAPFTWDLYNSPEVSEIISNFVGVKLGPMFNSELGHMNVSLASLDPEEVKEIPQTKEDLLAKMEHLDKNKDDVPSSLGLHYDSGTIALVIMLDLGEGAVGGETGIVTGDDKMFRVPDPKIGYATLIQGIVLKHVATKPVSNSNRITGVTGYAAAPGSGKLDNCRNTSNKPSVLPRAIHTPYWSEWIEYRFKNLEAHLKQEREKVMERFAKGAEFDQLAMIDTIKEMEKYLHDSWKEMEAVHNPPYPPAEFNTPYQDLPDYE
ncbi:hypothetical protein CANARDRAFT_29891 [[Candida] arabinofermentans NRRL YB-2248]|uniref:Fe2OG dioxygenase domain-containing protein n=1 Tax=[Candida] arabinofermentans NRRL YB-2248 TaxID=983967 RepID=A0A1E4SVY1_9ASCO|nr:hypothetical protein CANARDRAFT_29891 [[Candida] arabinofermentans NRRL YB-2248]